MRALFLLALIPLLASPVLGEDGVVSSKDYNFELRTPPDSIDWDIVAISEEEKKRGIRAHLATEWADSDPPAAAHVYVQTRLMGRKLAKMSVENIGAQWKDALEGHVEHPRNRKAEKTKLGGLDSWWVDVTGDHKTYGGIIRRQFHLVKNGKYLYMLIIDRGYDAVDDEDLDEELEQIIGSFKFHEIVKVEGDKKGAKGVDAPDVGSGEGASAEEGVDPERLKAETIKDDFWKFECVKPEGLLRVPTEQFGKNEKALGCKVKFERRKDQTLLMIRVYVKSLKSGTKVYTVQQLADSRIKYFERDFKKNLRQKPKLNKKYKLGKLTKKGVHLKLVGRRTITEVTHWYLVDCKNDRQYQLQIYITGGTGERVWKSHIDAFLKGFKPLK